MKVTLFFVYLTVLLVALYGWVNNIVIIFHSDFSHITGALVVRVIGVFIAPIGCVMGFF